MCVLKHACDCVAKQKISIIINYYYMILTPNKWEKNWKKLLYIEQKIKNGFEGVQCSSSCNSIIWPLIEIQIENEN